MNDPFAREAVDFRTSEAERAQDLGGVFAQCRRRAAQPAGRFGEAGNDIVHRQAPQFVIGEIDQDLAGDHMRIGHELVDVVDRRRGDLGALENLHVFGQCARADEGDDRRLAGFGVPDPVAVGPKPWVGDHVLAADRAKPPLGHGLDRGGNADVTPVLGAEDIARRGRLRPAAGALPHRPGQPVDRRFGRDEREQRVEQGQVTSTDIAP